jgi:hypothetical protein
MSGLLLVLMSQVGRVEGQVVRQLAWVEEGKGVVLGQVHS